MRIKKVSQIAGLIGSIVNSQSSSNSDTYSCKFLNDIFKLVETDNVAYSNMSVNNGTLSAGAIKTSINNTGTLAKLYGYVVYNKTGDDMKISFQTSLRPKTNIVIENGCSFRHEGSRDITFFGSITIKTTGVVEANWDDGYRGTGVFYCLPFLLFIKEFE